MLHRTKERQKGAVLEAMLWVDCDYYYGPDRRRRPERRLRERRRILCGERVPALHTALLQLRMRAFDAYGERLPLFIERVRGVSTLAQIKNETSIARELAALNMFLLNARESDPREQIYCAINRAQTMLQP